MLGALFAVGNARKLHLIFRTCHLYPQSHFGESSCWKRHEYITAIIDQTSPLLLSRGKALGYFLRWDGGGFCNINLFADLEPELESRNLKSELMAYENTFSLEFI